MRKGRDRENGMGEKMENNDVYSGHQRRCQSTAQTPTDWIADRSCQQTNQWLTIREGLKIQA